MRDNIVLGQYYPVDSVIHRLDPRTKLLFTLFYAISVFFLVSLWGHLALLIYAGLYIAMSRVPLKVVLRSLRSILILIIFMVVFNAIFHSGTQYEEYLFKVGNVEVFTSGLFFSARLALRFTLLIMGTSMLSFTTTPNSLTDGIERLLKPLTYIKIRVRDWALVASIALRFIPTIYEETSKIISAQKARGAEFDTGGILKRAKALLPVLIPVFVSSFRRADELALALDARCYGLSDKQTKLKQLKFKGSDFMMVVFVAIFVALIVIDRLFLVGIYTLIGI